MNNAKNIRLSILSLFCLSLCAMLSASCGDEHDGAEQTADSGTTASPQTTDRPDTGAALIEKYEVVFDTLAEKNDKRRYEISAVYPQIQGLQHKGIEERFNSTVRDSIGSMAQDFVESVMPIEEMEVPEGMEATSTFEVRPVLHMRDNRFLSIELAAYSYNAGAAHPNSVISAINFDLPNGRFLTLGDLFRPDAKYLKFISDYCMNELSRRDISDDEWISRGAGPEIDNYRTFFITKKALVIHFDPYQVAAYAAGPQQIEIPWEQLREMMAQQAP